MLKIIRFDYSPTCSLALFHEICHNIYFARYKCGAAYHHITVVQLKGV